jgi:hypothetical protein
MMARKAMNLLGSVSLMGGRLRKVTDKYGQTCGDDCAKFEKRKIVKLG